MVSTLVLMCFFFLLIAVILMTFLIAVITVTISCTVVNIKLQKYNTNFNKQLKAMPKQRSDKVEGELTTENYEAVDMHKTSRSTVIDYYQ